MRKLSMMVAAALVLALAPLAAQANNEENCLADVTVVIFSGTDAGATRRGLNLGVAGCLTAGDPDLPYVDTNIITPGATHSIVGVIGVGAGTNPGPGTFKLGDLTVDLTFTYLNDRWESQSVELPSDTGTVTVDVPSAGGVTYEKIV